MNALALQYRVKEALAAGVKLPMCATAPDRVSEARRAEERALLAVHEAALASIVDLELRSIVAAVCEVYKVRASDVVSARRTGRLMEPRQVISYLASRGTGLSLTLIGRNMRRDHTTILHGARKVDERIGRSPRLAAQIARVRTALEA